MRKTSAKTIMDRLVKSANSCDNKTDFWTDQMSIRIGILKKSSIADMSRSLELAFFVNEMFKKSLDK